MQLSFAMIFITHPLSNSNNIPHDEIIVNKYSASDGRQDGSSDTRANLTARRRKKALYEHDNAFFRKISAAGGSSDTRAVQTTVKCVATAVLTVRQDGACLGLYGRQRSWRDVTADETSHAVAEKPRNAPYYSEMSLRIKSLKLSLSFTNVHIVY